MQLYLSPRSKVHFGTVDIVKEQLHSGFRANELTQTRCGITESTIHLQISMSSPGFEPKPNSKAVSIANHSTGWVIPLRCYTVYRSDYTKEYTRVFEIVHSPGGLR
ncbi:hypothetical protein TNCV_831531 [Trichonephila clavipes]|nr:hypothetical protein TNCV_831531 [Trichonephila clavipes]